MKLATASGHRHIHDTKILLSRQASAKAAFNLALVQDSDPFTDYPHYQGRAQEGHMPPQLPSHLRTLQRSPSAEVSACPSTAAGMFEAGWHMSQLQVQLHLLDSLLRATNARSAYIMYVSQFLSVCVWAAAVRKMSMPSVTTSQILIAAAQILPAGVWVMSWHFKRLPCMSTLQSAAARHLLNR